MKILYVTDLDGTLLNSQETLSQYTKEVINHFTKEGGHFTFATARSLSSASIVTKGLDLKLPVIVYNGGFIVNSKSGEILTKTLFHEEEKEHIISYLNKYRISPLVYSYVDGKEKVSWICGEENEGMRHYLGKRKRDHRMNPLTQVEEIYKGQIFYITCIGEKEILYKLYKELRKDDRYNCIYQKELYREEYWLEIMPKKATKANAIKKLKELYEFDKIISFGDAINDIPMFQISDECYAVENAVTGLKKIATGIIACNDRDGVASWIEKVWK